MSIQITTNSEANGLGINTNHEALVALTQTSEDSGFTTMVSEKGVLPNGTRIMKELELSDDYRLRSELDNIWVADYPLGTAINTKKWATVLTTQTATVAGARYELNSSAINTVSTGSMLKSYKYIPFYKANATYCEFVVNWTLDPVANWFAEWGVSDVGTSIAAHTDGVFFRITAGEFRGVCINNGVESYVNLGTLPDVGVTHDFVIEITMGTVYFWYESTLLGIIDVPNTQFGPTSKNGLPLFIRTYNAAVAPASAIKLQVSAIASSNGGGDMNRLWPTVQAGMGNSSIQAPTGSTVGMTTYNVNTSAAPLATLSNTAAGYPWLGGQFVFAAPAGAETDYALFAYQVPTGNTLIIRGLWIDSINIGAAVATTSTILQWSLGVGSTAVSLATADAAATKAPARLAIGYQCFAIADAIGKQAGRLDVNLDAPLVVNSGEFFHIIVKVPIGTATASQQIRGIVSVNGYFE
jgi:hypothetical protein